MVEECQIGSSCDGEEREKEEKEKRELSETMNIPSTSIGEQQSVTESALKKEETSEERMKRMDALLNRKRKKVVESPTTTSIVSTDNEEDEGTKRRRDEARHKILWETERAKERAERMGPQGWVRPKSLNTNKEFLSRTIQSTLSRMQKREREDK